MTLHLHGAARRPSLLCAVLACWGVAFAGSAAAGDAQLVPIADGLDFPSNLAVPGDGSGRIFVLEKEAGTVRVIEDGRLRPEPFLDLSDRVTEQQDIEEGLVGLAFPPGFPEPARIYVAYTHRDGELVFSRFQLAENGEAALPESEEVLLAIERRVTYHHCGHVEFGPKDGYLYLCMGDSERQSAPLMSPQDPGNLYGTILRLDVSVEDGPYALPDDNPFLGDEGARPEVFAYGLRNPWRFTFDPATGDLFVPDVGWDNWEEINYLPHEGPHPTNFGWPLAEGNVCVVDDCEGHDLHWPAFQYARWDGRCAIIGGAVYRGERFAEWDGVYVFGDYCSGELWALDNAAEEPRLRLLHDSDGSIASIGTDEDGEILVLDGWTGSVHRLHFPTDHETGWIDAREFVRAELERAARTGFSAVATFRDRQLRQLDRVINSRRWRWTQWIADLRSWASDLLD